MEKDRHTRPFTSVGLEEKVVMAVLRVATWLEMAAMSASTVDASRFTEVGFAETARAMARVTKAKRMFVGVKWKLG
jgi:hypothetical protein